MYWPTALTPFSMWKPWELKAKEDRPPHPCSILTVICQLAKHSEFAHLTNLQTSKLWNSILTLKHREFSLEGQDVNKDFKCWLEKKPRLIKSQCLFSLHRVALQSLFLLFYFFFMSDSHPTVILYIGLTLMYQVCELSVRLCFVFYWWYFPYWVCCCGYLLFYNNFVKFVRVWCYCWLLKKIHPSSCGWRKNKLENVCNRKILVKRMIK